VSTALGRLWQADQENSGCQRRGQRILTRQSEKEKEAFKLSTDPAGADKR